MPPRNLRPGAVTVKLFVVSETRPPTRLRRRRCARLTSTLASVPVQSLISRHSSSPRAAAMRSQLRSCRHRPRPAALLPGRRPALVPHRHRSRRHPLATSVLIARTARRKARTSAEEAEAGHRDRLNGPDSRQSLYTTARRTLLSRHASSTVIRSVRRRALRRERLETWAALHEILVHGTRDGGRGAHLV